MNRRSFLAAVLGAMAAQAVEKLAPAASPGSFTMPDNLWIASPDLGFYRHFVVWDSAVMRPGEVIRERLLPPPAPLDFLITGLGIFIPGSGRVRSIAEVARAVSLEIKDGETVWAKTPLLHLPVQNFVSLPLPAKFQRSDVGIWLHSSEQELKSVEPVTVQVALRGLVRA